MSGLREVLPGLDLDLELVELRTWFFARQGVVHDLGELLASFADHYPHELSVGMRQRIGIGRAMVVDAPLLLMDEPFGALDAQTRRHMQGELLGIWASDRRTVVFVTHDIDEAVLLGDRVVVMSARPGRILANIPIPFARPRDLHRDAAEARAIVEDVWRLLDGPQGVAP